MAATAPTQPPTSMPHPRSMGSLAREGAALVSNIRVYTHLRNARGAGRPAGYQVGQAGDGDHDRVGVGERHCWDGVRGGAPWAEGEQRNARGGFGPASLEGLQHAATGQQDRNGQADSAACEMWLRGGGPVGRTSSARMLFRQRSSAVLCALRSAAFRKGEAPHHTGTTRRVRAAVPTQPPAHVALAASATIGGWPPQGLRQPALPTALPLAR